MEVEFLGSANHIVLTTCVIEVCQLVGPVRIRNILTGRYYYRYYKEEKPGDLHEIMTKEQVTCQCMFCYVLFEHWLFGMLFR